MKVISLTNKLGLTEGKEYEVIETSSWFYKIKLDNGNIAYREDRWFKEAK